MEKAIAAAQASPLQTFRGDFKLALTGSKGSLDEFMQLMDVQDDRRIFRMDRLISLPAFVEEGVDIEHPRSRDRWASMMWNTLNPCVPVTRLMRVQQSGSELECLQLDLQMEVVVPSVLHADERVLFNLGMEMATHFDDCRANGIWRLIDDRGNTIYGIGSRKLLIQEQTGEHDLVRAKFEQQLMIPEVDHA